MPDLFAPQPKVSPQSSTTGAASRHGQIVLNAGHSALATDLALPATKSNAAVCGRFDASELHPDPVDASPDDLRRAPNSGERVLNIEGARQPALPAKRELRSASRYIADTTRQRTALRHENLCGSIDGASGYRLLSISALLAPKF